MINRIKAHFSVYAGHWELALIILALVLGGVVTGYVLRGAQMSTAIAGIQAMHVQEVDRIQRENRATLELLASRIGTVAAEQAQTAGQVEQAARVAKEAATTAKGAAATAAKSSIRIREYPAPPPGLVPAQPERIEH